MVQRTTVGIAPPTAEYRNGKNGISATRLVMLINAPVLAVLGWMALVVIEQNQTIVKLAEEHKVIQTHVLKPWHDTTGLTLLENKKDILDSKEDIRDLKVEVRANTVHRFSVGTNGGRRPPE